MNADITFAAIARNNASCIAACLQSVSHLVDQMVIVDTGSDDDTVEIAEALGACVIRSQWDDDFAAARNKYLAAARCSWILSLDSDEALHPCQRENLSPLLSQSSTAFAFKIMSYFPIALFGNGLSPEQWGGEVVPGVGCTTSSTVRLFPNLKELRYCYPVHESLGPSLRRAGVKVENSPLPIHHFGYISSETANRSKAAMYRMLGEKKVRQFPNYFLAHLEMGKILAAEKCWQEAEKFFRTAVRLNPAHAESRYELARSVLQQGRTAACEEILHKALRRFPRKIDLIYLLGLTRLRQSRAREAVECFSSVLISNPEHSSTWLHLVDAYSQLDQPETAEELVLQCLEPLAQDEGLQLSGINDPASGSGWKALVREYARVHTELKHRKQVP
jgi:tetratricopeptide (TPR) repeat protein